MKQRIKNVLKKRIGDNVLSAAISNIIYGILLVGYYLLRCFFKGRAKLTTQDALDILNNKSAKPRMDYECNNKSETIDLSIIVPAYNAANTIEECVRSVINQKCKYSYELIIVNDGSTDNTLALVEKIQDSHIVLINQENRGFSVARNRGIDEATGRYITFLDSDDYLVDNCLEKMMDRITEADADIVQGSFYAFNDSAKMYSMMNDEELNKNEILKCTGYPWGKIYKRELFDKIRFPLDVWFEDTIVCMILLRMAKKIVTCSDVVYAWRLNPSGITSTARKNNKCVDHYWVMEHTVLKANEVGLPNDEIQYKLVEGHLSSLMYRRLSLQGEDVLRSAFVLACELLERIRPSGYKAKGRLVEKDIDKAFRTGNYKLWKWASFVV